MVPYLPLAPEIIRRIVGMQLDRVGRRVRDAYGAQFAYDDAAVAQIAARCTESASGARNVENILSRTVLPALSAQVLSHMADGLSLNQVTLVTDADGGFDYHLS